MYYVVYGSTASEQGSLREAFEWARKLRKWDRGNGRAPHITTLAGARRLGYRFPLPGGLSR